VNPGVVCCDDVWWVCFSRRLIVGGVDAEYISID
jgi:hypothetical protein